MQQAEREKKFWLFKSEPDVFSITDLKSRKNQTEFWDGVRNYQARNFMRDQMHLNDEILFYHSSCPSPGVAGRALVAGLTIPDPSSWNPQSPYFDPQSSPQNPRWLMLPVRLQEIFPQFIELTTIKSHPQLQKMLVVQRGMRLSIQPVQPLEFAIICQLGYTHS